MVMIDDRVSRIECWILGVVSVMAAIRGLVAGNCLLSGDEAYYWNWTRPLHLSYFDHPAMVAYWIWGGIHLLGSNELGVRLPALFASLMVTLLVWDTTRRLFASRHAAAWAALSLNASVLFNSGGIIITPDAPLLVFWMLVLWGMARLIEDGRIRWLYLAGAALGLGAISKYTMALILPGLLLTIFPFFRSSRIRFHTILAALLAAVCTTPLIVWNIENNGASFHKQLNHAFATDIPHPLRNLGEFLGGQIGLITPLLFIIVLCGMSWALWSGLRKSRPERILLGATSLPILAFFLVHTLTGIVQPHWAGPAWLGGIMATAGAITLRRRPAWLPNSMLIVAPGLGILMTLVVLFQAATAAIPLPSRLDALKRLGGWDELANAINEERTLYPEAFLSTTKHEITGVVAFYLPDHPLVFQLGGVIRPSYLSAEQVRMQKGRDTLLIIRTRDDAIIPTLESSFEQIQKLRSIPLHWGGRLIDSYDIYRGQNYRGGLMVAGDGVPGSLD